MTGRGVINTKSLDPGSGEKFLVLIGKEKKSLAQLFGRIFFLTF